MDARKAGAIALKLVSVACALCAVAMCALTVILCFNGLSARLGLVALVVDLGRSLPDIIAGYGVIPTPLGGVFRLDFACTAVVLFAIDYICARLSRALR